MEFDDPYHVRRHKVGGGHTNNALPQLTDGVERMMVRSFYEGQTFLYELVKDLTSH